MVSMLPNLVSRLNDFSDHLQVFFVFVFVFFGGGARQFPSSMPWACIC